MAVRYMDGFEVYDAVAELETHHSSDFLNWSVTNGASLVGGRAGGKAVSVPANGSLAALFKDDAATAYGSYGILGVSLLLGGGAQLAVAWCVDGEAQMSLVFAPDGSASILSGGVLLNTHAAAYTPDTWFHCEVLWTGAVGNGSLTCRINEVPLVGAASALPNLPAGRGINRIVFGPANQPVLVDDFVIYDQVAGAGYPLDNFQGDMIVQYCATSHDQATLYSAGDEYLTYLQNSVDQNTVVYAIEIISGYHIVGANPNGGAGSLMTQRARRGGSVAVGPGRAVKGSLFKIYSDVFPVDPSTNAPWMPSVLVPGQVAIGFHRES